MKSTRNEYTVTNGTSSTSRSSREVLLELLSREGRESPFEHGYLDVLGDREAIGRHLGQRMFGSRFIPLVYERISRPAFARGFLFKGGKMSAAKERRLTLSLLDPDEGDRVLDVGCGPGNYTRYIAEAVPRGMVVGIDPSRAMIAAAARTEEGRERNVAYVRGDGANLPFDDSVFDAASCVGALHMVEEPMSALDEIVRVVKPGGRLVLVTTWTRSDDPRVRSGMTIFGRDQIVRELTARGCSDVKRQVVGNAQFVSARTHG